MTDFGQEETLMKSGILAVVAPVVYSGAGFAVAWLILAPVQGQPQVERPRTSCLVRAEDAVPTRGRWGGWRRYFRGETHGTKDMVVLAVTLKPGHEPHPPHCHAEEEFMILAEGAGTWHLDGKKFPARKGDVVYAAPWTMHGLKNTGDAALTYYMVKWANKGVPAPEKPAGAKP
jgi:mannose-6-phosphate isomerase-like protein (cupin superfamily)